MATHQQMPWLSAKTFFAFGRPLPHCAVPAALLAGCRRKRPRRRSVGRRHRAISTARAAARHCGSRRPPAMPRMQLQSVAGDRTGRQSQPASATTSGAWRARVAMRGGGDPAAVQRAEAMLSAAFVAYARDLRHDPRRRHHLCRSRAEAHAAVGRRAAERGGARPLAGRICPADGLDEPDLRPASRRRSRAACTATMPSGGCCSQSRAGPRAARGTGRYVIVNPPAARLYMYENGQVVDSMRVVAGRPDPVAQTPMMNAFIRYVALNPYWNSPPDITAAQAGADQSSRRAAPISPKQGLRRLSTGSARCPRARPDVGQLARGRCRARAGPICGRSPGPPTRWGG